MWLELSIINWGLNNNHLHKLSSYPHQFYEDLYGASPYGNQIIAQAIYEKIREPLEELQR